MLLRRLLKLWSFVLLAVGIIWLLIAAYVLLRNFNAGFIIATALVAAASFVYPRAMKSQRLRPWTKLKFTRLTTVTLIYLLIVLSSFLFISLRGRTHTILFVAGLFVLYMGYISVRGWYSAKSASALSPDAATVVALVINVAASVISLHDLLSSFGSGVLIDIAIVMVVISTTSTKHSIISYILHSLQNWFKSIRGRPPETAPRQ